MSYQERVTKGANPHNIKGPRLYAIVSLYYTRNVTFRLEEYINKERNLLILYIDKIEHFPYKIKSNLYQI